MLNFPSGKYYSIIFLLHSTKIIIFAHFLKNLLKTILKWYTIEITKENIKYKGRFKYMQRFIYADNAATTAISKPVLDEMMPYLTSEYGIASSAYD